MGKNEIIKNIEEGLLNFYLENDDHVSEQVMDEASIGFAERKSKYENLAKRILLKAKAKVNDDRNAKVISIAEATGRLTAISNKDKSNVIPIFKKHIEEHGLAVNYRNLERMDEDEVAKILAQLDFTALLDEIDASLENE